MTDAESLQLAKKTAEGYAEGATRATLEKLTLFVETDAIVGDLARYVRWRVQYKILTWAEAFLKKQGRDPRAVPLKILVPLLERSSLEDEADDSMLTRWAALLANAAGGGAEVLPSFPEILAQLSSEEAMILDALYSSPQGRPVLLSSDVERLRAELVLEADQLYYARYFNLARLDLCRVHSERVAVELDPDTSTADVTQLDIYVERPNVVEATALGGAFIRACTITSGAQTGAQAP